VTGRFEGKVALVTGAGSGIGRAVTVRLAGEGAAVLAVDIDADRLGETKGLAGGSAESAGSAGSAGSVAVRQADISDPAACAAAVAACVDEHGRLDVLGNVAGIFLASHATELSVEDYRRVMGVNLDACFFLAQAALPHLLASGGNIVSIASNAGLQGVPYAAAYCMSKGGVVQLTRALAVEYLKTGLRVNAIAPAGTNTNLLASAHFPPDADGDLMTRIGGFRGLTEPDEVAALFCFLASDEARSITGAVYTLDNGLTAS
jgi:NAD(P)-dependent dehydrogenase (short-subunit alcohol dehydrogenase family)